MAGWSNWSGSVVSAPAQVARPRDEAELRRVILAAAKVRLVGAGHSFMPLCDTEGTLISMADYDGAIEIAPDRQTAWVPAGWGLARLTEALWAEGLSLINQGDVNPQSLAGALATGTHGTGADLGSLSTAARGFELMLADGTLVECGPDKNPDLYEAQRLSLGLFGAVTRIRIAVVPAYYLEERIERRPLEEIEAHWERFGAATRHFEFFVFPYADDVIFKTLHPVPGPVDTTRTTDIDEGPFQIALDVSRRLPRVIPPLQRFLTSMSGKPSTRSGPAWRIFPADRSIRFEEMEYELPRANGLPTLMETLAHIRKRRLPVAFPLEFRLVAQDDIWMSPFRNGPAASISLHQYARMEWRDLFADIEPVFQAGEGRPHWAKRHTLGPEDVRRLYPKTDEFLRVRASVDPDGKFLNHSLAKMFGVSA